MLNFEGINSPILKKNANISVKKSLKFNETPTDCMSEFETPSKIPKLDTEAFSLRLGSSDEVSSNPYSIDEVDAGFIKENYEVKTNNGEYCKLNFDLKNETPDFIEEDYSTRLKKASESNSDLNFGIDAFTEARINFPSPEVVLPIEENSMNFNITPSRSVKTFTNIKKTSLNFSSAFCSQQSSNKFSNSQTILDKNQVFSDQSQIYSSQSQSYSAQSQSHSVQSQSYKTHTPTRLRHEKSDSSIGSMASTPCKIRFPSESMASMESGFISELEEPFLEIEESNSPKISNFNDLLSGQIKSNILSERNMKKGKFGFVSFELYIILNYMLF